VSGSHSPGSQELARREHPLIGTLDPEEVDHPLDAGSRLGRPRRVRRLLLVRHASTSATRAAAFPVDEPLDEGGRTAATRLAGALPRGCEIVSSPALRCRQTAEAAGLHARVDRGVTECDFGRWAGVTLRQIDAEDPCGARAWILDPYAAPHGGESLRDFSARIGRWLDSQTQADGAAAVITHGGVVKAAVIHTLGAPLEAFWRIDAAPMSVTELHCHDARWTLARLNDQIGVAA
jgi:broad specificity phosphatase PhoE